MNRGKIVTCIGAVLLTIGIIGSVSSGIVAIPKIISNMQNAEISLNKEETLYKKQMNLTKLNIDSKTSNVIIKRYDGENIVVKRNGNKNATNITTTENGSELTVSESLNDNRIGKNMNDLVRYFVDRVYRSSFSNITVYVPDNIDINVDSNNNDKLSIDDVNINNLNFDTSYGNILLSENSNINNLNIKSNGTIHLKVREVYSTNNLSINASYVNIYEDGIIKDESKIPESVKILTNNGYKQHDEESVVINSSLPIAKKLDITSNETVELNLPILDHKFNFDIKASNSIYVDNDSKNKYIGTTLDTHLDFDDDNYRFNQGSFEGVINERVINNPLEYFVSVRSTNVELD